MSVLVANAIVANAQWTGPTSGILSTSNSVSISQTGGLTGTFGTTFNPLLQISLTGFPTSGFGSVPGGVLYPLHVDYSGNVGIGTNSPIARLHLNGGDFRMTRANASNVCHINTIGSLTLTTDGFANNYRGLFINNGTTNFFTASATTFSYGLTNVMSFDDATGTLLITNPTTTTNLFKVNASGYVYARKAIVTLTNPYPDYVFEKDYNLMPLNDVAAYIKTNHHLPNIKSEQEVKQSEGIDVGEMQLKLLEKVEELTLYVIQQQKQIDELKAKLAK